MASGLRNMVSKSKLNRIQKELASIIPATNDKDYRQELIDRIQKMSARIDHDITRKELEQTIKKRFSHSDNVTQQKINEKVLAIVGDSDGK